MASANEQQIGRIFYGLAPQIFRSKTSPSFTAFGKLVLFAILLASFAPKVLAQSGTEVKPRSMDDAIAILNQAREQFKTVRDYECRLVKKERINDKIMPTGVMTMRVRNSPLSVYLKSESPYEDRGLEVCYVEGQNHGMMRIHPNFLYGILGFISLNPRDPRVFQKSRHSITDAGLGNLLESTAKYWEMERELKQTIVYITDEKLEGQLCTRIDTIHPNKKAGNFYGYHCILWLDKTTLLPVGAETYDWPKQGGPEGGNLLERYRFLNMRHNIGLTDRQFAH